MSAHICACAADCIDSMVGRVAPNELAVIHANTASSPLEAAAASTNEQIDGWARVVVVVVSGGQRPPTAKLGQAKPDHGASTGWRARERERMADAQGRFVRPAAALTEC